MIRRPPRSTLSSSSAASDVYKRQPGVSAVAAQTPAQRAKRKPKHCPSIHWSATSPRPAHQPARKRPRRAPRDNSVAVRTLHPTVIGDKDMTRLMIIIASTRPGRVGLPVGLWFDARARARGGFNVDLADLAEIKLPFMDEPNHPRLQKYTKQHTRAVSY